MGFFSSLKGQLGRDTGRVITNKVYGNKTRFKILKCVDNTKTIAKNLKLEQKYELVTFRTRKKQ